MQRIDFLPGEKQTMRGRSPCLQLREMVALPTFEKLHSPYPYKLCDTSDGINSGDLKYLISLSKIDERSDELVTLFISEAADMSHLHSECYNCERQSDWDRQESVWDIQNLYHNTARCNWKVLNDSHC